MFFPWIYSKIQDLCALKARKDADWKSADVFAARGKLWAARRGIWHALCAFETATEFTELTEILIRGGRGFPMKPGQVSQREI